MVDQEQRALTISQVAVDWQEPMVLQRKCGHPLPALTDIGPAVEASKHTTAPINHTRPSPHKHSSGGTTSIEIADTRLLLTTQCPWRSGAAGKAFGLAISRSRVQILIEAALRNNLRQVLHTYVSLSPSSITWYRPKGGDAQWLGR